MSDDLLVDRVCAAVSTKPKYSHVALVFIRSLAKQECAKGWTFKKAVKQVSARLHQTGSAYFRSAPDYSALNAQITGLPPDPRHSDTLAFCRAAMRLHASTAERLPILDEFFHQTLADLAPIHSLLDIACGFNPLSAGWMPLLSGAAYYGVDIFADLTDLMQHYVQSMGFKADIQQGDITQLHQYPHTEVALILKTLPCLEQICSGFSNQLLENIPAPHLLISYPIRSLGGRAKGMRQTYSDQFASLSEGKPWRVQRFDFESELAFLISR
jgi:16S rRNA (guanine(1405)-N(7))-methyltransferase